MRENLFRGKTSSGRWVKGSLVTSSNRDSYIIEINERPIVTDIGVWNIDSPAFKVIPETVGQFTGLPIKEKNANGNEVRMFQGDIVKDYCNEIIGYIDWEYNRWVVRVNLPCGYKEIGSWSDWYKMGNIHDNIDLLNQKL